ncbi:MAG: YqaJ viral recombinase family protein [Candidatus Saccharimonadales bacterium]
MIGQLYPDSEWAIKRLGCFTSSEIDDLLTEPRSKAAKEAGELSETAKSYILKKASELITGTVRDFSNAAVEWGELYESEAAEKVQELRPDIIYYGGKEPKFFQYTLFSGGSPDGVSKDGATVLEIKVPENPSNHVAYCLLNSAEDLKKEERKYYHQIQMNMLCVAKEYGHAFRDMKALFASYCPIVTDGFMKLKTLEIYTDPDFARRIDAVLESSEKMLSEIVDRLRVVKIV